LSLLKKSPYKPGKQQVVLIDDAFIDRMNMECLFQPNAFLNDQFNAFLNAAVVHAVFFIKVYRILDREALSNNITHALFNFSMVKFWVLHQMFQVMSEWVFGY
jgi:hypothetical protein